jgi:phosphohistidine phosphatase
MELLIVRHAIAYERNTKRWPDDGARPLSPRGVMRARRAAAGLKKLALRPVRVLASPLERTQQTAAILTQFAGWPRALPCPLLLPGGSPQELLALLARTRGQRLAVIGHQPDLGRLIATCLPGNAGSAAFELRKMAVALIAFPGSPRAGQGELRWLVPPKLLRAVG